MPRGSKTRLMPAPSCAGPGPDLPLQPRQLERADAVLAGDGAAQVDGRLEDGAGRVERSGPLVGGGAIEHDRGVHVAVAGVAEGGDREARVASDPLDSRQQLRDAAARNPDVLEQRATAPFEGREAEAADLHEHSALDLVLRGDHQGRPRPLAAGGRAGDLVRGGPRREGRTGRGEGPRTRGPGRAAASPRRPPWWRGRSAPGARARCRASAIATTASPAASREGKYAAPVSGTGGVGRRRSVASVTTASVPSEPTSRESRSRPATRLSVPPPTVEELAVGEDGGDPEHALPGDAVLHAAEPARVGGDVAADRREVAAGGVGRVPEPVARGLACEVAVQDPGLGAGDHARGVDLDDPLHRLGGQDDARRRSPPPRRDSPLPAPRGTTATPWALATRMTCWTSAVPRGRTTARGSPPSTSSAWSLRKRSTAAGSTSTRPAGRVLVRSCSAPSSSAAISRATSSGDSTGACCRSSRMNSRIHSGWSGQALPDTMLPSTTAAAVHVLGARREDIELEGRVRGGAPPAQHARRRERERAVAELGDRRLSPKNALMIRWASASLRMYSGARPPGTTRAT